MEAKKITVNLKTDNLVKAIKIAESAIVDLRYELQKSKLRKKSWFKKIWYSNLFTHILFWLLIVFVNYRTFVAIPEMQSNYQENYKTISLSSYSVGWYEGYYASKKGKNYDTDFKKDSLIFKIERFD